MGKGLIAVIVIVVILLIFGSMYVSAKNNMVTKDEAIKSQWRQVDVVLPDGGTVSSPTIAEKFE